MLIREYIKYNNADGRKVNLSAFTDEIRLETATMLSCFKIN